ncbi:MarR family transcriptional regulator [Nocardia flavorosea]|uniref:MarR family winged helix-turn-helix transcriptional regulator n=1 Tax=Nocardia flavorosea TaxID=53429 RepID=UPI001896154F|nr:MarR family transcriptional regulator [Nocardia flavorosea]MBF6350965.1 MarR family transcriptional regulator [Nocardia flavorosea]
MCPKTTEPARISVELKTALEFYHGTVEDLIRELIRVLGVNETDRRALEILLLEDEKTTTPGMLAERLGLTPAGVTIMLNRLEKQGYITRSLHPTDRRRVIVMATELAGRRVQELVVPMIVENYKMLLSSYNSAELDIIADFLARAGELHQLHWKRLRDLAPYLPAGTTARGPSAPRAAQSR